MIGDRAAYHEIHATLCRIAKEDGQELLVLNEEAPYEVLEE